MRPHTFIWGKRAIFLTASSTSSVWNPNLLSSCATFTSRRILAVTPLLSASFSMVSASRTESTEWIRSTLSMMYLTLFSLQMADQMPVDIFGKSLILVCKLLHFILPEDSCPEIIGLPAAPLWGLVLLTAIRVTSLGSRPARPQALRMFSSTCLKLSCSMLPTTPPFPFYKITISSSWMSLPSRAM